MVLSRPTYTNGIVDRCSDMIISRPVSCPPVQPTDNNNNNNRNVENNALTTLPAGIFDFLEALDYL